MSLPPDVFVKALALLLALLCSGALAVLVLVLRKALGWMRAWVLRDIEEERKATEQTAMLAELRTLRLELLGDGTDDNPGVMGRIRQAESAGTSASSRVAQLEADLGLSDKSMRALRIKAMRARVSPVGPYAERIESPPPASLPEPFQREREILRDRYGTPLPPLEGLPPTAPKTLPRSKHATPYDTRHSTGGMQVYRKPKPDDEPPDSTGEE